MIITVKAEAVETEISYIFHYLDWANWTECAKAPFPPHPPDCFSLGAVAQIVLICLQLQTASPFHLCSNASWDSVHQRSQIQVNLACIPLSSSMPNLRTLSRRMFGILRAVCTVYAFRSSGAAALVDFSTADRAVRVLLLKLRFLKQQKRKKKASLASTDSIVYHYSSSPPAGGD